MSLIQTIFNGIRLTARHRQRWLTVCLVVFLASFTVLPAFWPDPAFAAEPPVITEGASIDVTMSEDGSPTPFDLTLHATDDGDSGNLTWSISFSASHGTASASGTGDTKSIGYTPIADYHGDDSFVVQVDDGVDGADTITVNVTIQSVNDGPPVITEGDSTSVTMSEDGSPTLFSLTLNATDVDGDTLTWSISLDASHGTASVPAGTGNSKEINYTPDDNYNGGDSFEVMVDDSNGGTDTITVNVTIESVNDAPVITEEDPVSVTMSEDGSPTPFSLTLNATDVDGDALTWSISSSASHGIADASGTGNSKDIGYIPDVNYHGSDSFDVMVDDSIDGTDTITVNVTIEAANETPVVTITSPTDGASFDSGVTIDFAGTATDPEDGNVTDSLVWTSSLDGEIGTGGGFSATLSVGDHIITAEATDSVMEMGSSSVSIHVTAVNQPPVVTITSPTDGDIFNSGVTIDFAGTATDPEDGDVTVSLVWTSDLDGEIGTGGSFSTSTLSVGDHTITATATDGDMETGSSSISISVNTVPEVTTQPVDQTVAVGQAGSFTAEATGYPIPGVQWQLSTNGGSDWADIPGATSTTYTTGTTTLDMNGYQYRAVFTNSEGSATTNAATLMVVEAPEVNNVTSAKANGTYSTGEIIDITVTFSEVVNVTGTPLLELETGITHSNATYDSGSGTATLIFRYVVQAGDSSSDLDYRAVDSLKSNESTIRNDSFTDAVLTLPPPGEAGSLGSNKNLVIDTGEPVVTNVTSAKANGTYSTGEVIDITVTFSEPVNVTGTPLFELETGSTDRNAAYDSGTGTDTLTFRYTVQAGDNSSDLDYKATDSLKLNGGTIEDADSNNAILLLPPHGEEGSLGYNKDLVIYTGKAVVTNVTSVKANGTYPTGEVIDVTVTFSEVINVTGTPYLELETGDTDHNAYYVSGNGTDTLTFRYTVQAGDSSSDLDYKPNDSLKLNGGTIKDVAGYDADLTLPVPGEAGSLGANKALVINTSTPLVMSVSSDKADGCYTTGEVIYITVTFSEMVNVIGIPRLELETGATDRNVDYIRGTGTNTLTFRYTVQAGDSSSDLDYKTTGSLKLNGGTIEDADSNNAILTLAVPGDEHSLGSSKDLVIDTTEPVITPDETSITTLSNEPTISGKVTDTGSPIVKIEYRIDEGLWESIDFETDPDDNSSVIYNFSSKFLLLGEHTIEMRATDSAGNTNSNHPAISVNISSGSSGGINLLVIIAFAIGGLVILGSGVYYFLIRGDSWGRNRY